MAVYILFGPPGAGKGSMAEQLKQRHDVAHLSTGDALREEMANGTDLGNQAKLIVAEGKLVPDAIVMAIVTKQLTRCRDQGHDLVLDGFPRTISQAEQLDKLLAELDLAIAAVACLEAPEPLLLQRLTQRRICRNCSAVYNLRFHTPQQPGVCDKCGGQLYQRDDDKPETARKRLEVYRQQTQPLVEYYQQRNLLRRVDASGDLEANGQALRLALAI